MFMIFWRGKGGLVFLSILCGTLLTQMLFGVLSFLPSNQLVYILRGITVTIASAAINWYFTKRYISDKSRILIDEETHERIQIKDGSHLFFIPNKYWTPIILIGGIFLTIASSFSQTP